MNSPGEVRATFALARLADRKAPREATRAGGAAGHLATQARVFKGSVGRLSARANLGLECSRRMRFGGEAAVGVLTLAIAAAVAQAAPPEAEAKTDSAIVVTGERVRRSLKDTPSSVAVFGKRDLEQMAAPDRIQDVLAL